jgi:hypothetical protein
MIDFVEDITGTLAPQKLARSHEFKKYNTQLYRRYRKTPRGSFLRRKSAGKWFCFLKTFGNFFRGVVYFGKF